MATVCDISASIPSEQKRKRYKRILKTVGADFNVPVVNLTEKVVNEWEQRTKPINHDPRYVKVQYSPHDVATVACTIPEAMDPSVSKTEGTLYYLTANHATFPVMSMAVGASPMIAPAAQSLVMFYKDNFKSFQARDSCEYIAAQTRKWLGDCIQDLADHCSVCFEEVVLPVRQVMCLNCNYTQCTKCNEKLEQKCAACMQGMPSIATGDMGLPHSPIEF